MYPVKQSTSLDTMFYAFDANGDAVLGLVTGDWTKRISKGGAAFGAMTVTVTEAENGWYAITLSSSHTDTLGVLSMSFSAPGTKQINLQFRVSARLLDDLAFPNVSGRGIDVDATGGVEITPGQSTDANVTKWGGDGVNSLITGRVDATVGEMQSSVLTADALAADAVDEILDDPLEGSLTVRQALRIMLAVLAGKSDGGLTSTIHFRDQADTKNRQSATVDPDTGNRTAVTVDGT